MNHGDEVNRYEQESDPLDRILGDAEWPEPSPVSLARLENRWRARLAARRWRKVGIWIAASAAAMILSVSLWWRWPQSAIIVTPTPTKNTGEPEPGHSVAGQPEDVSPEKRPGPVDPPKTARSATTVTPVSRPPTDYEVLIFQASERQAARAASTESRDALLTATLERVSEEISDEDLRELSQPLMSSPSYFEGRLLAGVRAAEGDRLRATARLLGQIGGERSVPTLIRLSHRSEAHAAAVRALSKLGDSATLSQLVAAESDADLQQVLLAGLLSRGELQSVRYYLHFVTRGSKHEAALAAADRVANPPIEVLFQFMQSPAYSERFAAARALGRINGPEVSERLIGMVAGSASRQEAMVALLSSEGAEVQQFLAQARQDPLLASLIRIGEDQLQQAFQ